MFVHAADSGHAVNLTRATALRVLPPDGRHVGWGVAAIFSQRITLLTRHDSEGDALDQLDKFVALANEAA